MSKLFIYDVKCPYCGVGQFINHDDEYGMEETKTYDQECVACREVFNFKVAIILEHTAWKKEESKLSRSEQVYNVYRHFKNIHSNRNNCLYPDKEAIYETAYSFKIEPDTVKGYIREWLEENKGG